VGAASVDNDNADDRDANADRDDRPCNKRGCTMYLPIAMASSASI
jgi:hypothetical protein